MIKINKNIIWVLVLTIVIATMPVMQREVKAEIYGDFEYTLTDGVAKIIGYYGEEQNVVIPSEINGYQVKSVGDIIFDYDVSQKVKSVIISEGIISIDNNAFLTCSSLESVEIPNSVTNIGFQAFGSCTSLESIEIPSSVTSIGEHSFRLCTNLKSVKLSNSVTKIGDFAFFQCESLKSVKIPESITSMGRFMFWGCSSLNDIKISDGITSIGEHTFYNCTSLKKLKIPKSVTQIEESDIPIETTIYGYRDSAAQTYAETNGNKFVEIGVRHEVGNPKVVTDDTIMFTTYNGNSYTEWEAFEAEGEGYAELQGVNANYGNYKVTMDSSTLQIDYENISSKVYFEADSYNDYIIPAEVIESWKNISKRESNVYMVENVTDNSFYVSSVYGRVSTGNDMNQYIDVQRENMQLLENSKHDLIISAVGVDEDAVYYISQDEDHRVSSSDGKFLKTDLYNTLRANYTTYAYVKNSDGTTTAPVEIKLEKIELDEDDKAILELDSFSLFGDGSNLTIADDIPVIGGSEISMASATMPIGLSIVDNKIRISLGVDIFEKEDGWGDELKWDEFKESFDVLDEINDGMEDSIEAWDAFESLASREGVKIDEASDNDYSASVMGYAEGQITEDGIVFTDVYGEVAAQFVYEYSQQTAIWAVPTYFYVEAGAEACFSFDWLRVVPDKNIPFEFNAVLEINPEITVGGGAGIKGVASAGLYGSGGFGIQSDFSTKHLSVNAVLDFGVEGEFFIISGEKSLLSATVSVYDGYFAQNSVAASYTKIVKDKIAAVKKITENQTNVTLLSREYLKNTSDWLGGDINSDDILENKGLVSGRSSTAAKSKTINVAAESETEESIKVIDLQTSVYRESQCQVVTFGNKMMMAWIEDSKERDDYNRMRLVYSVYEPEEGTESGWSEPKAVYDNGCLDSSPSLASDGENVYIAWQNINTTLTNADENTMNTILQNSEIMFAQYDEETDSFVEVKRLTDNTYYDYEPSVSVENDKAVVYWVRNNTCDFSAGTHSILKNIFGNSNEIVSKGLNYIASLDSTNDKVSYMMDTDGDLTTVKDMRLYTDGKLVGQASSVQTGVNYTYGKLEGKEILFYTEDSNLHYIIDGEVYDVFEKSRSIESGLQVVEGEDCTRVVWTELTENGSKIMTCKYENGIWNQPVQLYAFESVVSNFSAVYYDNAISGIFNRTEMVVGTDDEGNVALESSVTDLCQMTVKDYTDLEMGIVIATEAQFIPGTIATFDVLVKNVGTEPIEEVEFTITDTLGSEFAVTESVELLSGSESYVELSYSVPANFAATVLTVEGKVLNKKEADTSNNFVNKDIGFCDIKVDSLRIEDVGSMYKVTGLVKNNSGVTATDVLVDVVFGIENVGDSSTVNVGNLDGQQEKAIYVIINKEDITFENSAYMVYFEVNTSAKENNTKNNKNSIAITDYAYYENPLIIESKAVEINGYQMNVNIGGLRTVYSVESEINGKEVVERGLVYGLKDYADVSEMYIEENSEYVMCVAATSKGVLSQKCGTSSTATSYAMTMTQDIESMSAKGLSAEYYVRGYARLGDGSYVYSPVYTYSIFGVAKSLYDKNLMATEISHNYLYDIILSVVEPNYPKVEFDIGNELVPVITE